MKTIKLEELLDLDLNPVDYSPWRWGYCVRYQVNVEGQDYMTEYIYYHCQDGQQGDPSDDINLFPCALTNKLLWDIIK